MGNEIKRKYGLLTAIAMVVGIVIGSGVFFKAQTVLEKTKGDMPLGILAWVVGGIIMLCCLLAFAVMATRYEKVNGLVDYAEALVGPRYGYVVGWFSAWIYYPSMTSVLAWVTARYLMVFLTQAFPSFKMAIPADQGGAIVGPECMVFAMFLLCFSYAINALSPKLAGKLQVSTTFIKMIPLVLMAVVGIIVGLVSEDQTLIVNFTTAGQVGESTSVLQLSPLFAAVVATAFAYEGWIIATSINAELKNAKRNLPIALVVGGLIIVLIYVAYYIGVAGGATNQELIDSGATLAFLNVFGKVFGNVLNAFVVVSCFGTLNGLMLASTRGMFAVGARGRGPKPKMFGTLDSESNMATNSAVAGLLACAAWLLFFYVGNLAEQNWLGVFAFDSSELPIITIYALYLPIFIQFMRKAKGLGFVKRILLPLLATIGSLFMVVAALLSHGVQPFLDSRAAGKFICPVLFYLIIFAVVVVIGILLDRKNGKFVSDPVAAEAEETVEANN